MALITNAGGYTYQEIIDHVVEYIGNSNPTFSSWLEQTVSLAEFRFCKAHDWSFLRKQDLSLSITNGTSEYTLSVANIGFYMTAANVETIYSPAGSTVLKRQDLGQIRRADPEQDDGSATTFPRAWAPGAGENKIVLWPPIFINDTLRIDGKISPAIPSALSERPIIPYRYQENYIEYIKALALDKENDDRAPSKRAEFVATMRSDIQDDQRDLGNTDNQRIKHWREAQLDGLGGNLEAILFGLVLGYD